MASSVSVARGLIEVDGVSSRREPTYEGRDHSPGTNDLARLLRRNEIASTPSTVAPDEFVLADMERLAEELEAEYAAVSAIVAGA